MSGTNILEPTLVGAVRQNSVLGLIDAIVAGGLAVLLLVSVEPGSHPAETTILLESRGIQCCSNRRVRTKSTTWPSRWR
jgi:hypothetical protein